MQKVRRHFIIKTSTAYRVTNSSLFHYVNTILFKLSFTVLFAIAKFIILSLRGWFPFIPTSFLSSYLLFSLIINLQDLHLFLLSLFFLIILIDFQFINFTRLIRFHSPLLSESRLISFPFLTRMICFRKFLYKGFP